MRKITHETFRIGVSVRVAENLMLHSILSGRSVAGDVTNEHLLVRVVLDIDVELVEQFRKPNPKAVVPEKIFNYLTDYYQLFHIDQTTA